MVISLVFGFPTVGKTMSLSNHSDICDLIRMYLYVCDMFDIYIYIYINIYIFIYLIYITDKKSTCKR